MKFPKVHYTRVESGFVEDFVEATFGFPIGMTRKMWLYLKLKSSGFTKTNCTELRRGLEDRGMDSRASKIPPGP